MRRRLGDEAEASRRFRSVYAWLVPRDLKASGFGLYSESRVVERDITVGKRAGEVGGSIVSL